MIQRINDTTIVLTPNAPKKRRPYKQLNVLETEVLSALKSAIISEVDKQMWLRRQFRRVARYEAALERRGYSKSDGLPGWTCPADRKVMLRR